ncbi:SDR family NAD(P)-dependent oxidoreductase [Pseudonocardia sp. KRD-184]|uniref:SDR family NAD(P)-dependent oxidoreductase n=1 Tax=Pseudonocardia oceani TaxID=2792013 RepID=A0ABS6UF58_9PSEU|nr:SDR family NAD(P)-dependent oxidoreductase [Pseudonocardia oceani]MBW0090155.1 SDR family NAD(P)-dependent oxidoreductase [Pseudonocardia oceani]MBW0097285.1 SDR family NAD(P)-dependent oxidoreductase [Pseudonocardia oceani]MBW0109960.1 SDR family NAD(P)-dependent oxidoreductase [Pseudonocardia oceani]MBW0120976.1 SDR family NAD(P)-dependent oxidoreductase [Pseudonocardia oceani]MBW0130883.1 SDR family NAD(P)-dependent oxidoreductase [Pseudonocardia oceani]
MDIAGISAVVTGGASGLGLATAHRLAKGGAHVVLLDLPGSRGAEAAAELGGAASFVAGDVTTEDGVVPALDAAQERGPLRAVVHCAGRGHAMRVLRKDGSPGSLEDYAAIVQLNLIGSFNVLRLAASRIATTEPVDGERGAVVLTASVAAWEGQIGQIPYASSKAGVVGMTLVAARDLATHLIRVATIAPGIFDTPLLGRLPQEVRDSLGEMVPHPRRLGVPDEFGALAVHVLENPMINGETIRLDGAIRMAPR